MKVGGMRVVQHKRVGSESEKEEKPTASADASLEEEEGPAKTDEEEAELKEASTEAVAAETYHKFDKDFPKDAVNAYHVKPQPTKDIRVQNAKHQQQQQHINQPRKE